MKECNTDCEYCNLMKEYDDEEDVNCSYDIFKYCEKYNMHEYIGFADDKENCIYEVG